MQNKKADILQLQKSAQVDECCSKVDELQGKCNIFFKNHEILFKYFADEAQTPCKHEFFGTSEDCISYFPAPVQSAEVKQ